MVRAAGYVADARHGRGRVQRRQRALDAGREAHAQLALGAPAACPDRPVTGEHQRVVGAAGRLHRGRHLHGHGPGGVPVAARPELPVGVAAEGPHRPAGGHEQAVVATARHRRHVRRDRHGCRHRVESFSRRTPAELPGGGGAPAVRRALAHHHGMLQARGEAPRPRPRGRLGLPPHGEEGTQRPPAPPGVLLPQVPDRSGADAEHFVGRPQRHLLPDLAQAGVCQHQVHGLLGQEERGEAEQRLRR
mmetsp:Transcript_46913/g.132296  ORF Transcript_46913/g.132296 Transcript_46913/m.132296 type:complete len:247 (-) Transcript_46913:101-841(-)